MNKLLEFFIQFIDIIQANLPSFYSIKNCLNYDAIKEDDFFMDEWKWKSLNQQ